MVTSEQHDIGRAELLSLIRSSIQFFGDDRVQNDPRVRDAEIYSFLQRHGRKTDKRWEVSRLSALEKLKVSTTTTGVDIQFLDSAKPLAHLETSAPTDIANEVSLRLRWSLGNDRSAKSALDVIEGRQREERWEESRKREDAGRERIQPRLQRLRRDIRRLAPLFEISTWELSKLPGLQSELAALDQVRVALAPREARSGKVDEVVRQILREFDLHSLLSVPELLSAVGYLVNADDALGVLNVREHYLRRTGHREVSVLFALQSGHRPHTEVIKSLRRHVFEHPGYLAPVEDLLDWLALEFYAAKRAGDAEDGAVGSLVDKVVSTEAANSDVIPRLAEESKHWTVQRLTECVACWRERVRPLLEQ